MLIGVEAAGFGVDTDKHAATLTLGTPGVLHGSMSYLIQDADGQIIDPHSISAGLDYPGTLVPLSCSVRTTLCAYKLYYNTVAICWLRPFFCRPVFSTAQVRSCLAYTVSLWLQSVGSRPFR